MLKHSRSRYLNPPLSFCCPICSQLIHAVFFSLSLCPHQNWDIIEFISLHNVLGNRNTLIVYIGIACTTALSRISFSTWKRNFSFHPVIRSQILHFISVKALIPNLSIRAESPRYFSYRRVGFTLATATIWSLVFVLVFLLKKREVFSLFSLCPEADSYICKTFCICNHSKMVALQKSKLSSAKNKWFTLVSLRDGKTRYSTINLSSI